MGVRTMIMAKANERIAELEAKCSDLLRTCSDLEAENQQLADHVRSAKRLWEDAVAHNQRLREAAQEVVEGMRGSGGINPRGAQALLELQALLEGVSAN